MRPPRHGQTRQGGNAFRYTINHRAGHPGRSEAQTRDPFRNGSGMDPGSARLRRLSGMTSPWRRSRF